MSKVIDMKDYIIAQFFPKPDDASVRLRAKELLEIADPIQRAPWCYACLTCEEVFADEDAIRITEPHGEVLLYCPKCGSGEIE